MASRNEVVIRRFVDGFAKFVVRRAGGEERPLLEIRLESNAPNARQSSLTGKSLPAETD